MGLHERVLSDLQAVRIGGYERHAVALLADTHPDVVFVAGDLFQGSPHQFGESRAALPELLTELDAPGGVFVVPGDVDDPGMLRRLVAGTPATYLENDIVEVAIGDRTLRLGGLELHPGAIESPTVDELTAASPGTITILLAHRPDWVFHVEHHAVDLVVAGHTHGGQIQLPFYGPLKTESNVPRAVAAGGLHEVGGTPIYVSRGVGREQQGAPQIRFLARPNVGLITLQ